MDIRNWPLGQIMQLPDCCFGRRFLVSCYIEKSAAGTDWDISELALPEKFVLWEVELGVIVVADALALIRIALGDHLPAAVVEVDALEPLLPGFGVQGPEPRTIQTAGPLFLDFRRLRQPYTSMGRRVVMEATIPVATAISAYVGLVVSSMPTEVPDCLISEYLRSR